MSKQFLTRNFQQRVEIQKAKSKAGKKATVQGKANQAIATGMANAVTVSFTKGMTTFKKRVDSEALSKHIFDGEFEKAVESFRTMHKMEPENPFYQYLYSMALAANQQVDEAGSVADVCDIR